MQTVTTRTFTQQTHAWLTALVSTRTYPIAVMEVLELEKHASYQTLIITTIVVSQRISVMELSMGQEMLLVTAIMYADVLMTSSIMLVLRDSAEQLAQLMQ